MPDRWYFSEQSTQLRQQVGHHRCVRSERSQESNLPRHRVGHLQREDEMTEGTEQTRAVGLVEVELATSEETVTANDVLVQLVDQNALR
jgi:hypothetical protein